MSRKRAVVVGGCGFLGQYVTARLLRQGLEVTSVHRSEGHHHSEGGVCIQADYRDVDIMSGVLSGVDVLVHLGSQSVPRTSVDLGVTGILGEVQANSGLFETAARVGVPRVVFASSGGSVYGNCEPGRPITENHSTRPISPHGLLKAMTELVLAHIALKSDQEAIALRPGNIYGPGQRSQVKFGVVPTFISNLRNSVPCEIWGAEVVRDYVYVTDAAEAFVRASTSPGPFPRALNVGTGRGSTAIEIYSHLQRELGTELPVTVKARPESDPPWNVLSVDMMRDCLGFEANVSIADGLARTVATSLGASAAERSR